jgi:hypothetical protein
MRGWNENSSAKLPAAEDSEEPLSEWSEGDGHAHSRVDQLPKESGDESFLGSSRVYVESQLMRI